MDDEPEEDEWDEMLARAMLGLKELVNEVSELSLLLAELTSLSAEDARGVTIAESEYALIGQKLLTQQARLNMLLSGLPPEGGAKEDEPV